jgi:hypothetical protein
VEVGHRVLGGLADVEDQAVAAAGDALLLGDQAGGDEQLGDDLGVGRLDRGGADGVVAGDHQHVDRGGGADVTERQGVQVFVDHVGWYFFC